MHYLSMLRVIKITLISLTAIASNSAQSCTYVNMSNSAIYHDDAGTNDECDSSQIMANTSNDQPNYANFFELEISSKKVSMSINHGDHVSSENASNKIYSTLPIRGVFGIVLGLTALLCLRSSHRY